MGIGKLSFPLSFYRAWHPIPQHYNTMGRQLLSYHGPRKLAPLSANGKCGVGSQVKGWPQGWDDAMQCERIPFIRTFLPEKYAVVNTYPSSNSRSKELTRKNSKMLYRLINWPFCPCDRAHHIDKSCCSLHSFHDIHVDTFLHSEMENPQNSSMKNLHQIV